MIQIGEDCYTLHANKKIMVEERIETGELVIHSHQFYIIISDTNISIDIDYKMAIAIRQEEAKDER